MISRRAMLSLVAGSAALPDMAFGQQDARKVALYANVGADLTHYDVDVKGAALVRRGTVSLPAGVQYAWPHASGRYLYVASSTGGAAPAPPGTEHHVTAIRIDPTTGALTPHGAPIRLPTRPIHITTDIPSQHLLVTFNIPSSLRVYRINADATPGAEVPQPNAIAVGVYPHQTRVTADNRMAVTVARGNDASTAAPEDPGALKVFSYRNGILSDGYAVAPAGGKDFGPRHLDFHPTRPWVYVSLERQNKLHMFRMENGRIAPEPAFRAETRDDARKPAWQTGAGTVHVHPNGRFVYVANRAFAPFSLGGRDVIDGPSNSIAVFAIDQTTGEPVPLQRAETHGNHPRTFHIDPSGRIMVVQHNLPADLRENGTVQAVAAGMTVFRIGDDGKLTFVRKYDVDVAGKTMFWMGMVPL